MAQCYKLCYINNIVLLFEFQKGGFDPRNPPLGAPLSQAISGDFAKVFSFTEGKNFTIALSVFMVVDSHI